MDPEQSTTASIFSPIKSRAGFHTQRILGPRLAAQEKVFGGDAVVRTASGVRSTGPPAYPFPEWPLLDARKLNVHRSRWLRTRLRCAAMGG